MRVDPGETYPNVPPDPLAGPCDERIRVMPGPGRVIEALDAIRRADVFVASRSLLSVVPALLFRHPLVIALYHKEAATKYDTLFDTIRSQVLDDHAGAAGAEDQDQQEGKNS